MSNKKYLLTIYEGDVYKNDEYIMQIYFDECTDELLKLEREYEGYYYTIDEVENDFNLVLGVLDGRLEEDIENIKDTEEKIKSMPFINYKI